ncbi:hypothetical protein EBU24_06505, partial [bacterium]|nr:hypothetical protein [bacterium]
SSLKRKHKNDDCDSDDCDDNYTTKRKPMIDGIEQDTTKYPHYYKKDKEDGFWKCTFPECRNNYKTKISSNIIAHNRSHTDDKPYQCEYTGCKKAFTQSSNLKKHTRTHTNEKPYTCTEIGHTKAFTTSSELTMHRSKNTDEKPYKCTHPGCIKAFTQPGDLTIHRRKHPGEKPCRYTDPECTYTFADDSNLRKHTNSLHKIVLNNNAKDDVTNNIKENDDKSYDSTNN